MDKSKARNYQFTFSVQIFHFWSFLTPWRAKHLNFRSQRVKNAKIWKSELIKFCLTSFQYWSKFQLSSSFLAKLVLKMCFWDIANLVKIRDFPWFWPNFGHLPRDKTLTRHLSGNSSLLHSVTHKITWENT